MGKWDVETRDFLEACTPVSLYTHSRKKQRDPVSNKVETED